MNVLQIQTPFNIELEFSLASTGKRVLAHLIDIVVGCLYVLILTLTVFDLHSSNYMGLDWLGFFVLYLPLYAYQFIAENFFHGQTIGKRLMGVKVISENGHAASTSQCVLRWMLSFGNLMFPLVAFYIVYHFYIWILILHVVICIPDIICMFINDKGKRIADLAAHTVVVNTKHKADIFETIFVPVPTQSGYTPKYPEVLKLSDRDINALNKLLQQKRTKELDEYTSKVEARIKQFLEIENISGDSYIFFEELLTDYNFLTQNR